MTDSSKMRLSDPAGAVIAVDVYRMPTPPVDSHGGPSPANPDCVIRNAGGEIKEGDPVVWDDDLGAYITAKEARRREADRNRKWLG